MNIYIVKNGVKRLILHKKVRIMNFVHKLHHRLSGGGIQKMTLDDMVGVWEAPKKDDVIYEQPLHSNLRGDNNKAWCKEAKAWMLAPK